jgi:hypothetical protein
MDSHLVSLHKLKRVAKDKGLLKFIKEIGYSKVKNKKYYVITIDNKKVNFGSSLYDDFLTHHDDERRKRFKARFQKLFNKFKDDYNKSIFTLINFFGNLMISFN